MASLPWPDVGSLLPNPWGLYDMGGSVMEWVLDGMRTYTSEPQLDPVGPMDDGSAVIRGSSSGHPALSEWQLIVNSRSASRSEWMNHGSEAVSSGFRLLRQHGPSTAVEGSCWGEVKRGGS